MVCSASAKCLQSLPAPPANGRVGRAMHGWVLVLALALVSLVLADVIVWFVIAQRWP